VTVLFPFETSIPTAFIVRYPLLYIGFKYVKKAQEHFEKNDGTPFTSKVIGTDVEIWDKKTGPAFSKP
jgi:AGCS family alanine or glycine:cation symporter